MAVAINFEEANISLGPPKGMTEDEVYTISALRYGRLTISCWKFTPEELMEIANNDGVFYLSLMTHIVPPAFIGTETEINEILKEEFEKYG